MKVRLSGIESHTSVTPAKVLVGSVVWLEPATKPTIVDPALNPRSLGLTTIIVSHDVNEALSIADYVYIISNKTIMAHGVPADIMQNSSIELQQFIQGLPDGPVPFHYPASPLFDDLLEGEASC